MKILVGTLYTIENEFEECRRSIQRQTYTNYDHIVIKDLPKREAHDTLYGTFMEKSDTYDLLVKVDADMVLCKNNLFEKIVEKFSGDSELDLLLIAVQDYFTDELLIGINVFRNSVRWEQNSNDLMTDRVHIRESIRKTEKDYVDLAPAAVHCPDPSPFQAFHFGFHRGMKAYYAGSNWRILRSIFRHYRRNPDTRLAYALLGANAAFTNRFTIMNISYNDDTLLNYFNRSYAIIAAEPLQREVKRSKIFRLLSLPIDKRVLYWYYRLKSNMVRKQNLA
jgi:hypothetical protein